MVPLLDTAGLCCRAERTYALPKTDLWFLCLDPGTFLISAFSEPVFSVVLPVL